MVSASFDDNTIRVYKNLGNINTLVNAWGLYDISTEANSATSVFTIDLDDDDDMDILSATVSGKVRWHENDSPSQLDFTSHLISTSAGSKVFAVDVDNDGDTDILSGTRWFENDGNENFTPHSSVISGGSYHAADLDNDGDMEVIATTTDKVVWYEMLGDNCPAISNPDQTDTDGDGVGDACDD